MRTPTRYPPLTAEEWGSVERICNRFIGEEINDLRACMQAVLDACMDDADYKVVRISIIASRALGQAPPTQF